MESLFHIVIAGATLMVFAMVARRVWRDRDSDRRRVEREAYEGRQKEEARARGLAAVAQLIDRFFPFAKAAWADADDAGDPRKRLRRILAATDGVTLGMADIGFHAVLPDSARRQHLVCLGKSGYGKTTIALRMIRQDLRHGGGICILGSEEELFRDWVLPLVPGSRGKEVIYFKISDPACTLTWNALSLEEGDDQALAAGELFAIFKRAIGETTIGARADAILSNAFSVLVGRRGATLWSVIRILEDEEYRAALLAEVDDPYLLDFWTKIFPSYPAGAALPIANRLNQFLRLPQLRAALCHPISSFSIREALAEDRILLLDLSGLDPDATRLVGQMLLSKFQIELMRRERVPEAMRNSMHVYVDEFHAFADSAEGTWRELLARGRRYGLALHLFTQHPNQLPRSLQHEIFGNVSSVIALNLSAGDAATVRRELLVAAPGDVVKPVAADEFVSLPVGEGFARLGSGACALRTRFSPPIDRPDTAAGGRVRAISWETYAAPPLPPQSVTTPPVQIGTGTEATPIGANAAGRSTGRPQPGRGGEQHRLLQRLAREWGEERGFRVTVEQEVLGGAGRVDVVLVRGDVRIAVEVAITSAPQQVAAAVNKALAAGFGQIVVLSPEPDVLRHAEDRVAGNVTVRNREKVQFLTPDGFRLFLDGLPALPDVDQSTVGYRVSVGHEPMIGAGQVARRRALARLVGSALLRLRWPA